MKPLKIEIKTEMNVIQDEKEILDGYEPKYFVSFIPDFLEKHVYNGKDKNNDLKYYLKERKKYTYIGTWQSKTEEFIYTEYYYDKKDNIICYLIFAPMGHYPSLQSVMIYHRNKEVS